jgi:hypothetical protein
MKHLIFAAAMALSAPGLAEVGKPFEQLDLDRALPQSLPERVVVHQRIPADRMPFEQSQLDRGITGEPERVMLAQLGNLSYRSAEEPVEGAAGNPWANDYHFIAPAQ